MIPYFYHLIFGTIKSNLELTKSNNVKGFLIICISFIFINFIIYSIDLNFIKRRIRRISFKGMNSVFIKLIIVLLFFVVIAQVFLYIKGGYYSGGLSINKGRDISLSASGIIGFFSGMVRNFTWIGLSLLYFTKYSGKKNFKFLFWSLLILNGIYFFPSGSKIKILMPILLFIFCSLIFIKKHLGKIILISSVIIALFFSFYNAYRNYMEEYNKRKTNISYSQHLSQRPDVRERGYVFFIANSFVRRLDTFSNYLILSDYYPDQYSFLKGESYWHIILSPVPRLILPWKPKSVSANEIGRKTGIISSTDYVTSPGISWWGEAYVNFGYWGIFFVLFITMLFYQIFFFFWVRHKNNLLVTAFYITLILHMVFHLHGGIGGLFGGFIKLLLILIPLLIILDMPYNKRERLKNSDVD
ncbi:MAG: oligosaccharide repeat unit polymerase [Candidatus Omnitrophica bacterium]|nr:oligosaccharide repeat unit polymerase [Candidatus Omnitrophota bacterium]